MKFILLFKIILPITLVGQNSFSRIDSVMRYGLGDTTFRKVYYIAEEMPKLLNGEQIVSFFMNQSFTINSCCAFKAYIGFVVEADSSISNKMVFVRAVNCEKSGIIYHGPEIKTMELRIYEIIDKIPRLSPGKIHNKNVAVKISFPVHVDCYMR